MVHNFSSLFGQSFDLHMYCVASMLFLLYLSGFPLPTSRLDSEELAMELEEFKSQLHEFMKDESREELVFPSSLTGRQRKRIHEVRVKGNNLHSVR